MKKNLLLALTLCVSISVSAQTFKEDFEFNSGWTEISNKNGEAVMREGVMHLECRKGTAFWETNADPNELSEILTTCYLPMDVTKNFEISCKVFVKKISGKNNVGLIFDYFDNYNYKVFSINDEYGYYFHKSEGEIIGFKVNRLKIQDNAKTEIEFNIKSTYNKIEFFMNNMLVMELRYVPLVSNGFGFCVCGNQSADFDDLEVIQ